MDTNEFVLDEKRTFENHDIFIQELAYENLEHEFAQLNEMDSQVNGRTRRNESIIIEDLILDYSDSK